MKKLILIIVILISACLWAFSPTPQLPEKFKSLDQSNYDKFTEILNTYAKYPADEDMSHILTYGLWRMRQIIWPETEKRKLADIIIDKYHDITSSIDFKRDIKQKFETIHQELIPNTISNAITLLGTLLYLSPKKALSIITSETEKTYISNTENEWYHRTFINGVFNEILRHHYFQTEPEYVQFPKITHDKKLYDSIYNMTDRIKAKRPNVRLDNNIQLLLLEREVASLNSQKKAWHHLKKIKNNTYILRNEYYVYLINTVFSQLDVNILYDLANTEKDVFYKEMLTVWVFIELRIRSMSVKKDVIDKINLCINNEPKLNAKTLSWYKKLIEENYSGSHNLDSLLVFGV